MPAKTVCPITDKNFQESAKPLEVKTGDLPPLLAEAREFSTGSLGWYVNGKSIVDVGGTRVSVQIGMNITIVGSTELPKAQITASPARDSASRDPGWRIN